MKIIIIEARTHVNWGNTLIRYFLHRNDSITLLTVNDWFEKLKHYEIDFSRIDIQLFHKENFLQKVNHYLKKSSPFDYIIFPSPLMIDEIKLWQILRHHSKQKVILTIHNLNNWFTKSLFHGKKLIRFFLRQRILKRTGNLIFLSEQQRTTYNQVKKNYPWIKTSVVPNYFSEKEKLTIPKNDIPWIVIPGSLSEKRKNWKDILYLVEHLDSSYREFVLCFLGGIRTDEEREFIHSVKKWLENKPVRMISYNDSVPNAEFEEILQKADLLFSPVQVITEARGMEEIYGKTKISGSVYDALFMAKPILIPKALLYDEPIKPLILSYTNGDDLMKKIQAFLKTWEEGTLDYSVYQKVSLQYTVERDYLSELFN